MTKKENPKVSLGAGGTSIGRLPTIYKLRGYDHPGSIVVLGCGGTGAYVIAHLSRLLSVLQTSDASKNWASRINFIIADGDVVEEKNLIRQHFIHSDIGRNKAEVLAERYSAAFGIQIGVAPKDIESGKELMSLLRSSTTQLVIGCVDNNATRRMLSDWFNRPDNYVEKFWIDSGNEEKNGQVVCGFSPKYYGGYGSNRINVFSTYRDRMVGLFSTPCATDIYPSLLENSDKFNSQISCAENAVSAPQNMQTNVTAATLVVNYINKILAFEPISSHCVEFSIDNAFSTRLNTPENLKIVPKDRCKNWESK